MRREEAEEVRLCGGRRQRRLKGFEGHANTREMKP